MTKLGAPIWAGPKLAIVVVGLAGVGEPPLVKGEPPLGACGGACSPPPVALGKLTPPSALPLSLPLPPMLWLWVAPLRPLPLVALPSIVAPTWTPLPASGGAGWPCCPGRAIPIRRLLFQMWMWRSWVRVSRVGVSLLPSLLSLGRQGRPLGVVPSGVVGSIPAVPTSGLGLGLAPAMPTPSAVAAQKLARAMVSASLYLIPGRLGTRCHGSRDPCSLPPRATGPPTLLAGMGACNGSPRLPTSP